MNLTRKMMQVIDKDSLPKVLMSNKVTKYSLNQDVYLFFQDEVAQLLDFRHGQFYGLDSIGTLMVSSVLEQGEAETVKSIAQSFGVTEKQISVDLVQLLQNLEQKKLIIAHNKENNFFFQLINNQKTKAVKIGESTFIWVCKKISVTTHQSLNKSQTPSRQTIELLLTLSWISFRLLGWSRTISLWQNWHQHSEENETSDHQEVIKEVDQVVREAAAWKLFLPMVCKERALVGYHILRTFYGLPANLIVGIDHYPFQIHAWVECNDMIVTDDPEHCEPFIPVIRHS